LQCSLYIASTAVSPVKNTSRSIHALSPIEIGGTIARCGFALQDHVAACHCLDMLEDETLAQVWCETQDDVTLLWRNSLGEEVEFVQVKANELDQLWTIAKLLEKEQIPEAPNETGDGSPTQSGASAPVDGGIARASGASRHSGRSGKLPKRPKHCILEKSLQYDRCDEPVRFRIVTARPVADELAFLTRDIGSHLRDKTQPDYLKLIEKVKEKIGTFKSDNGNDCVFWIDRSVWRCVHSMDALKSNNLWRMNKIIERTGQYLATDQVEELYQQLLTRVYDGGLARWDIDARAKKITREELEAWFTQAVHNAAHPASFGTGRRLNEKLSDAGIASDQYEAIAEMRHRYRHERLTPKYDSTEKRTQVEADIRARLMTLRSNLDGMLIKVDGVEFHAMCINSINEARASLNEEQRPPAENLYGYMYDLADRCTHRFTRAKS
jgi:Cap4 dsDNA endonuclease